MEPRVIPQIRLSQNAIESPHVVILGAGASVAACPKGDRFGRTLPVMRNLVTTLGLGGLLMDAGVIEGHDDFEALYSSLCTEAQHDELRQSLEERVRCYFEGVVLPAQVTVYDQLLLCLREKDMIATFNWDPFLMQAIWRNRHLRRLPEIVFLHGNVGVGICVRHHESGYAGGRCSECGGAYQRSPLLYPVGEKNYREDPFIASQWARLERKLRDAFLVTIFGYSAPASDVNARELLQLAWDQNGSREFCQIEVIDIRPGDQIIDSWKSFIVRDHFQTCRSLNESLITKYPRRSCDAFGWAVLQCDPWSDKPVPRFRNLQRLQKWCQPLIDEELGYYERGEALTRFMRKTGVGSF